MVQVKVNEGILEGEELVNEFGGKIYSFKGVPYAAPPVGELRFKAPQPPKPWQGVRSAKQHGPICYQFDVVLKTPPSGSEDCLYLNVYSPNLNPSKPLPVMFYIHGGGFIYGSGNDDLFGPEFLIRHDVILVTINYRLEVLGFLSLDTKDIPGNAGMKDQVAALRWVKENISNFGGDPNNVTIFGESSGSVSVTFHLISPMSKGLFKRAIGQSGAANWWATSFEPRERAKALARKLGLDSDDDNELFEFLKKQPVENLINIHVPLTMAEAYGVPTLTFGITNEKKFGDNERFFYGHPYDAIRKGIHEGVEVIQGYCEEEGFVALASGDVEKIIKEAQMFLEHFASNEFIMDCPIGVIMEVGRRIRKYYFGDKKISMESIEQYVKFVSMQMFVVGIIEWLKISSAKNKVYLYKFTCKSERNWFSQLLDLKKVVGDRPTVSHGDDLGYLFPLKVLNQKVDKESETFKLIDNVTRLWTNFAKYGNPTPDDSLGVKWSPYTQKEQNYLDIGNKLVPGAKPDEEEIQFWENLYKEFRVFT